MKQAISIVTITLSLLLSSCTSSYRAKLGGYGDEFKIEVLSPIDGKILREWISVGKVKSEASSDGYYFKDKKTGKLIEVTGFLVISQL